TSTDGVTWTLVPGSSQTLGTGPWLAGLAITSRAPGVLGTATMDCVRLTAGTVTMSLGAV
ncbi:MAG: hypothetical protein ACRDIE_11230, partial [Chloroflexota bacterium]